MIGEVLEAQGSQVTQISSNSRRRDGATKASKVLLLLGVLGQIWAEGPGGWKSKSWHSTRTIHSQTTNVPIILHHAYGGCGFILRLVLG